MINRTLLASNAHGKSTEGPLADTKKCCIFRDSDAMATDRRTSRIPQLTPVPTLIREGPVETLTNKMIYIILCIV